MRDRVKADVYYVENWSLLLDLRIIAETIWNMIFGKGRGV
jgi:undecaprenyl-phosphate galactose phosphotransferase/putative colanic acid biosynthesis UDP-glucose lipid carrier transferase